MTSELANSNVEYLPAWKALSMVPEIYSGVSGAREAIHEQPWQAFESESSTPHKTEHCNSLLLVHDSAKPFILEAIWLSGNFKT